MSKTRNEELVVWTRCVYAECLAGGPDAYTKQTDREDLMLIRNLKRSEPKASGASSEAKNPPARKIMPPAFAVKAPRL